MDATLVPIDSDARAIARSRTRRQLWNSNDPADVARLEAQARLPRARKCEGMRMRFLVSPFRPAVRWRAQDLARESSVGVATIRRAELTDDETSMTAARPRRSPCLGSGRRRVHR